MDREKILPLGLSILLVAFVSAFGVLINWHTEKIHLTRPCKNIYYIEKRLGVDQGPYDTMEEAKQFAGSRSIKERCTYNQQD